MTSAFFSHAARRMPAPLRFERIRWSMTSVMACAVLMTLTGCAGGPSSDPAAAAVGFGDPISPKTLDNMARPPKQVVYRFDEHRYIENDPGPGYSLPCQAELFYVDEKLGIRTQFGGNSKRNPEGLFKVDSPYVVVRSDAATYVSFDKGRSFKLVQISGGSDVVVSGQNMYIGGGGDRGPRAAFREWAEWFVIDPTKQEISLKSRPINSQDPEKTRISDLARAEVQMTQWQDPKQYYICKRDLPMRPSLNRERQLQQKSKTLSKPSQGANS